MAGWSIVDEIGTSRHLLIYAICELNIVGVSQEMDFPIAFSDQQSAFQLCAVPGKPDQMMNSASNCFSLCSSRIRGEIYNKTVSVQWIIRAVAQAQMVCQSSPGILLSSAMGQLSNGILSPHRISVSSSLPCSKWLKSLLIRRCPSLRENRVRGIQRDVPYM